MSAAGHGERTGGGGLVNRLLLPPHAALTPCPHLRLQPRQLVLVHAANEAKCGLFSESPRRDRKGAGQSALAFISQFGANRRRRPAPPWRCGSDSRHLGRAYHVATTTQPRPRRQAAPVPSVAETLRLRREARIKRGRAAPPLPRVASRRLPRAPVHRQGPFSPPSGRTACVVCVLCSGVGSGGEPHLRGG